MSAGVVASPRAPLGTQQTAAGVQASLHTGRLWDGVQASLHTGRLRDGPGCLRRLGSAPAGAVLSDFDSSAHQLEVTVGCRCPCFSRALSRIGDRWFRGSGDCTLLQGHFYPPGYLPHWAGGGQQVSTEHGTSLGEENGVWVGRGLHMECRLRRGFVPGTDSVGVWGGGCKEEEEHG